MSLYPSSKRPINVLNGAGEMDSSAGTINPAALNSGVVFPHSHADPGHRGLKRSRSPDNHGGYAPGDEDDPSHPRKRGRPAKTPRTSGDYASEPAGALPTPSSQVSPGLTYTPQGKAPNGPHANLETPTRASPSRNTPKASLKALPTVRDHTSDQLNPSGDEYVAREFDDSGEQKVDDNGYLQGGREYRIKTFTLPDRGTRLFMLATECARTLQYRDSYLLFNKNRSLFKIIASPREKEELVKNEILPYSYRSRQIAVVTARSMFRQFGSRMIKDGRRVRDDYWEAKARKQGFTEDDAAGEKRPGAARAREAAAAEALGARQLSAYGTIVYSNGEGFGGVQPPSLPPGVSATTSQVPVIDALDAKFRDITRPRQEMTGVPYTDLTRTSSDADMASQASHGAEYSKTINQQGRYRNRIVDDYWKRPHEPPVSTPQPQTVEPAVSSAAYPSPRFSANDLAHSSAALVSQQSAPTPMNPPSYPSQQASMPSPARQSTMNPNYGRDPSQFPPAHPSFHRSPSNLSMSQSASQSASLNYGGGAGGYSPHGVNAPQHQGQPSWGQPPAQPHQSPSMNRMSTPQAFSPHIAQGHTPSPMPSGNPSQSPHPQQMQPPQMFPPNAAANMGAQTLIGPGGGLRAMGAVGYPMGMPQQPMYGMGGQAGHYMAQSSQQSGPQNWGQAPSQGQAGQGWQGYQ